MDMNNIPELSEKQIELIKEMNRHEEAMNKIEADKQVSIKLGEEKTEQIRIEQEQKSVQKKCDVGISFGDAIKALAPFLIAVVDGISVTKTVNKEEENASDKGNVSEQQSV